MDASQLDAPEMTLAGCDPWLESRLLLEQAVRMLDLEDWIRERLRQVEREITVNLPLRDSGGRALTCAGFRVQHSSARGPCLGEVEVAPEVSLGRLRARAAAATWQWAILDVPLGGSAGALLCDVRQAPERELRQLLEDYVQALRGAIGPSIDVLSLDGGNDYLAGWIVAGYRRQAGGAQGGAVVGKPAALGGLEWSWQAPGWAVEALLEEALAPRPQALAGMRIAIQGLGKIGSSALDALHGAGARVLAVADSSGGLHCDGGIDVPALRQHLRQSGVVYGFAGADPISNAALLETPCDALLTSTPKGQLHAQSAGRIQARIVLEGAEEAITAEAEQVLLERGVLVISAALGTAGTALAHFAEWSSAGGFPLKPQQGKKLIRERLGEAYRAVSGAAERFKCSLRIAAQIVAVERVSSALRLMAGGA